MFPLIALEGIQVGDQEPTFTAWSQAGIHLVQAPGTCLDGKQVDQPTGQPAEEESVLED